MVPALLICGNVPSYKCHEVWTIWHEVVLHYVMIRWMYTIPSYTLNAQCHGTDECSHQSLLSSGKHFQSKLFCLWACDPHKASWHLAVSCICRNSPDMHWKTHTMDPADFVVEISGVPECQSLQDHMRHEDNSFWTLLLRIPSLKGNPIFYSITVFL